MAAGKSKGPKLNLAPPPDPDIWPDIDVLSDEQIARAKRCWDAFDATKVGEVAAADLGAMLRSLGFQPTQVRCTALCSPRHVCYMWCISDVRRINWIQ